jgi:adenosylcobinamide-phosphate synthase
MFYRAVNPMDAMIGYHGRYEYLGKTAARLDDLLNFLPARITAAALLIAGGILGHDVRRGWRIMLRDGQRTESPNAGRPMAAMAGLLGIELAKEGHYRLGDPEVPLAPVMIAASWRIVTLAAALVALAALMILKGRHGHLV